MIHTVGVLFSAMARRVREPLGETKNRRAAREVEGGLEQKFALKTNPIE
jgi:hypothetical protein